MWKRIKKEKYKDPEPQPQQNSLSKPRKDSGQSQEIDDNMLLSPKIQSKSNKVDKYKIGIDQVDKIMVGISQADVDKETDSKISHNFPQVLGKSLEIKQSYLVPQSSSQMMLKTNKRQDEISLELPRVKAPADGKQRLITMDYDTLSHRQQSSQGNNSQQLQPSSTKTAQLKSFSLGGAKQGKHIKQLPQPLQITAKKLQGDWNQDQPVILYSEKQISQDKPMENNRKIIKTQENEVIENQGVDMEDFFNQMREAGIDISDLQSNHNKSRADITLQYDQSPTFKKNNSTDKKQKQTKEQKDKQPFAIHPNMFHFDKQQQQDRKQKLSHHQIPINEHRIAVEQSNQLKKTKIKCDVDIVKLKVIFNKIIQQIQAIRVIKQDLQQNISKFEKKKAETNKEIKNNAEALTEMFNKFKIKYQDMQKSKANKLDQNKLTQQLRYKVLQLEAEMFEKQGLILRQAEQIQEFKTRNEELNESLFDKNQRMAQNQLIINKKVNEIIQNIGIGQVQNKKQKSSQQLQIQIQRLSEEVEELTRLYNNSQQQHKSVIQKQKVAFTIEMEKIARKEANWHQKQQLLEQKAKKLQEQQAIFNIEKEKITKRQQQLDIMQRKLEEKIMQLEKLQIELNQGFAFLEEAKEQNQEHVQRVEAQKDEILAEVEVLKKKIFHLEQQLYQYKQKQVEYDRMKQKSLISSLYEHESRSRHTDQRSKNTFNERYKSSTQFTIKNDKRTRFATTPYENVEEENEDQYYPPSKGKFTHHFCEIGDQKNRRGHTDRFLDGVKLINSKKEYRQHSPYSRKNEKYLSQVVSSTQSLNSFPKIVFLKENSGKQIKDVNIRSLKARYQDTKSKLPVKKQNPSKKTTSDRKLNELDSKIESLRSEIKREIISAKQN